MALIKCPECGRMISELAPSCPGCGVLKEDIQRLLKEAEQVEKPSGPIMMKPVVENRKRCTACQRAAESDQDQVCRNCGYPYLTFGADRESVEKAVQQYKKPATEQIDHPVKMKPVTTERIEVPLSVPKKEEEQKKSSKPVPIILAGILACVAIVGFVFLDKKLFPPTPAPVTSSSSNTDQIAEKTSGEDVRTISETTEGDSTLDSEEYPEGDSQALAVPVDSEEYPLTYVPDSAEDSKYDIGDTVTFGTYEQDNNTTNGPEDIEWRVLDKQGDSYLLISQYALETKPYNTEYVDVTWETCSLRNWLNNDFINQAFDSSEQAKIQDTLVTAEKNPLYDTDSGSDTEDKAFLLSIQEAEKYFSSNDDRKAKPTAYAKNNGAYVDDSTKCCYWWLRSPGDDGDFAANVGEDGWVYVNGLSVRRGSICVRPALWVNL